MRPTDAHDRRDEIVFVDVREPYEWEAGRIEGATHIPMSQIQDRLDEVPPDRPVVAVCRSGARSGRVAAWLHQRGYDAHNLDGGMKQWARDDLPFTAPDGGPGRVA